MTTDKNPIERDVEEMAERYVELVYEAAAHIAPLKPWYWVELSPEQQLWRYVELRDPLIGWLVDVSSFLPDVKTFDDLLDKLEWLFTGYIEDLVSPHLLVDERADNLKELVQAAGPHEAAKHVRKMERLVARRAQAESILQPAREEALGFDLEEQLKLAAPVILPEGVV